MKNEFPNVRHTRSIYKIQLLLFHFCRRPTDVFAKYTKREGRTRKTWTLGETYTLIKFPPFDSPNEVRIRANLFYLFRSRDASILEPRENKFLDEPFDSSPGTNMK